MKRSLLSFVTLALVLLVASCARQQQEDTTMPDLLDFQTQWETLVAKWSSQGYDSLTEAERTWFNVQSLTSAVANGGFVSYFYNPGGERSADALGALETVGAHETKALLQKMINLFPNGQPPADLEDRNDVINSWDEDTIDPILEEIDDQFFKQDEKPDELLVQYLIEKGITPQQGN
jgi:hypothetical protein